MPTQANLYERKASLGVGGTEHPRTGQCTRAVIDMIRHEKLRARSGLEALHAVPRHVLDHQQCAVHDEDVI